MANYNIAVLDGVVLPVPAENGITVGYKKIWSKNTGRGSTGLMVGDIVAIKQTVDIKWTGIGTAEYDKIHNIVDNQQKAFVSLTLKRNSADPGDTIVIYSGDTTYPINHIVDDETCYADITINFVEQ